MRIEIEEEKLYEFIRRAVKEAFEECNSVISSEDDIEAHDRAIEELDGGESVDWDNYKAARIGS